jgi:hypothetical protein
MPRPARVIEHIGRMPGWRSRCQPSRPGYARGARLNAANLPARHVELDCEQVLIPCLVESGLFRISRKLYGEIGPAFYGLRTTLLTLLLVALLRIKRPEHLKERDPAAFGYVDTVKVSNGQQAPNRLIIS